MTAEINRKKLIIVRGGGDIATGTVYKLHRCGFAVLVLETKHPSAIRRYAAFSEAVYEGTCTVEGVCCERAASLELAWDVLNRGKVAMLVDPSGDVIKTAGPEVLVDAVLAKKNLGTNKEMAPLTIALGPGFTAGKDVDVVVETMRGHSLGRLVEQGEAIPNTGIPGSIAGIREQRVIYAGCEGILKGVRKIAELVEQGETIAYIEKDGECREVKASISGILRGLIRDGYPVTKGFKIADIDPRKTEYENCFTISDKARCIAGGVLEAVVRHSNEADKEKRILNSRDTRESGV